MRHNKTGGLGELGRGWGFGTCMPVKATAGRAETTEPHDYYLGTPLLMHLSSLLRLFPDALGRLP